jgi:hypothetical protein
VVVVFVSMAGSGQCARHAGAAKYASTTGCGQCARHAVAVAYASTVSGGQYARSAGAEAFASMAGSGHCHCARSARGIHPTPNAFINRMYVVFSTAGCG